MSPDRIGRFLRRYATRVEHDRLRDHHRLATETRILNTLRQTVALHTSDVQRRNRDHGRGRKFQLIRTHLPHSVFRFWLRIFSASVRKRVQVVSSCCEVWLNNGKRFDRSADRFPVAAAHVQEVVTELLPRLDQLRFFRLRNAKVDGEGNDHQIDVCNTTDRRSPHLDRSADRYLERRNSERSFNAQRDAELGFEIEWLPANDNVEINGEPRGDAAGVERRLQLPTEHETRRRDREIHAAFDRKVVIDRPVQSEPRYNGIVLRTAEIRMV